MKGKGISTGIQRGKYILSDWLMSSLAFFLFDVFRYKYFTSASDYHLLPYYLGSSKMIAEQILIPVAMLVTYWMSGFYNQPFNKSRLQELVTTFLSALLNSLLIYFILLVNESLSSHYENYEVIGVLFMLLLSFTYIGRLTITQRAIGRLAERKWEFNTLIVGNSREARNTAFGLSKATSRLGYNVIGFVRIPGENNVTDDSNVYEIDQLKELCAKLKIDQLILSPETQSDDKTLSLLHKLFPLNIPIKIAPDTLSYITRGIHMQDIYGEPLVDLTTPCCSESTKNVKRVLDFILSATAIIILSPFYILIAAIIALTDGHPVFFTQERIGYHQKPFRIIKFRTMRKDAEKNGPALSSENDDRITPVGHFLRKYRIDEFPQFFNVLKGDMSLVGPRPERLFFIEKIVKNAPWYALVHQVRPGITSWGMVKYGYASDIEQMIRRARYELIYLANMSLLVDLKILIYTVKTVITGKGV